jgi:hypothetical protein
MAISKETGLGRVPVAVVEEFPSETAETDGTLVSCGLARHFAAFSLHTSEAIH